MLGGMQNGTRRTGCRVACGMTPDRQDAGGMQDCSRQVGCRVAPDREDAG